MVAVEDLRPLVEKHALGQPGRSARVHQYGRIDLLALVGDHRVRRREQICVGDVVRDIARADQDDLLQPGVGANRVDQPGEERVDETDPRLGITQYIGKFLGCEPEVQRVDDAAAEKRCVVQLEVRRRIERHHGEAVATADPQAAEPTDQTARPVEVLGERRELAGCCIRGAGPVGIAGHTGRSNRW